MTRAKAVFNAAAIALLGTLTVGSGALLFFSGQRVYQDWQILQQKPDEENQRRFSASLEVLKATVGGIGTLATIAGGAVLYLNFRVANRNAEIAANNLKVSEEKQVTERFAKAIEHLGNGDLHVRLGGIYALERIARDSAKDHWTIMEILSAYVRKGSTDSQEKGEKSGANRIATDIQAALTVIGRRQAEQDPRLAMINLADADLASADLVGAHLDNADLTGANLSGARVTEEQLKQALLCKTTLRDGKTKSDRDCKELERKIASRERFQKFLKR